MIETTNLPLLFIQIASILLIIAWLVWIIISLSALNRRNLPPFEHFLWAALILFVPLLGAAVFWYTRPDGHNTYSG
jgi:hypothetical protein